MRPTKRLASRLTGGATNGQSISLGTTSAATGTITNDDAVPTASVTVAPASVLENGAANLVYTVTLDHASQFDTTVTYALGGNASSANDYTATPSGFIVITAGATSGTITVDPTPDTTFETDETVSVTLTGGATNGQSISLGTTSAATGTITNDDAVPTASVTVAPASVLENGAANLVYTVTLDHASQFDTTVTYALGGNASSANDYTATPSGFIVITAGATSGTITVDPTPDTTFETDETVSVTLTGGATNGQSISLGTTSGHRHHHQRRRGPDRVGDGGSRLGLGKRRREPGLHGDAGSRLAVRHDGDLRAGRQRLVGQRLHGDAVRLHRHYGGSDQRHHHGRSDARHHL